MVCSLIFLPVSCLPSNYGSAPALGRQIESEKSGSKPVPLLMEHNYRLYLAASVITSFAGGIFGPFYILFVRQKGGGIENFGVAMGLLLLFQSLMSYFAGRYSDKFGRKPLFLLEGYLSGFVVLFYLFVGQIWQLYALQIINGLLAGIHGTAEVSFLGDITKFGSRGERVGKFHATTGVVAALAMMASGYLVATMGLRVIFILMAIASFISTTVLLFVKEKN